MWQQLIVQARDLGTPALNSTTQVIVPVWRNLYPPTFDTPTYTATFDCTLVAGSLVQTVRATDRDQQV